MHDMHLKDKLGLEHFCERWNISKLELFGSVARGEDSPGSDIDLLVTFGDKSTWTLMDLIQMESELGAVFNRKVDLVLREAVEESHNWIRKASILESTVLLYAA